MRILTIFNFVLICFVSLYGIVNQRIYENKLNTISFSELLGEDVSNLVFGVIGLFITFMLKESSKLLKLVLLGILLYFIYMYSYYCISIISGIFFIAYLTIFGVSFYLFIFQIIGLTSIDLTTNIRYPRKALSFFFLLVVLIMTFLELPDILKRTMVENKTITLFQEYYILDLSIVFPGIVIIAIMNLKKKRYSPIWAGIALLKILSIMPALLLNELFYWIQNSKFLDFQFVIISSSFILVSAFLFIQFKNGIDWNIEKCPENQNHNK